MRTTTNPRGGSRWTGTLAVGAALLGTALVGAGVAALATGETTHPRVADGGCAAAGGAGGVVRCQDVLNNSLNDISVHILGH